MTNNKQKTAVEWLIEKLTPFIMLEKSKANTLIEQAKEIEKEQIVDAWISDRQFIIWSGDKDDITDDEINELANDYYNETYGGNNEQQ